MSGAASEAALRSPLYRMTSETPTCLWNDSASIEELTYSIENGAVGATCNPVIVVGVLKKEIGSWQGRIRSLIETHTTATEDEIGWKIVREMSVNAAALLMPIFHSHKGRNGRLSIQTDPRLYRDSDAMVRQAEEFSRLAENIIVKIPATLHMIVRPYLPSGRLLHEGHGFGQFGAGQHVQRLHQLTHALVLRVVTQPGVSPPRYP